MPPFAQLKTEKINKHLKKVTRSNSLQLDQYMV